MLYIDNKISQLKTRNLLVNAFFFLLLAACVNTPEQLKLNSVQFIDFDLRKLVTVDNLTISKSETGNTQVNMLLQNISKQPLIIEVSVGWYDANFIATEDSSRWQQLTISPFQTQVLQVSATSSKSSHFVINIRNGGS
ncbi:hypothetical protein GLIP_1188 [Aliiglaciecola lipolytica E3]|uniref:Lipoprotein n=2 Tax=Aliiglaciecola TaxID=1406885 RepID=K6WZK0_9ALTE|nr:hypothetical protein GLIP_1188 [Aliiglaciecola lipolytica E3]